MVVESGGMGACLPCTKKYSTWGRDNFFVLGFGETPFCMEIEAGAALSLLTFRRKRTIIWHPKRKKQTFLRELRHDGVISQSNNGNE